MLRLVAFAATTVLLTGITHVTKDSILAFEEDFVEFLDFLSPLAARIVIGVGSGLWLASILVVYLVPLFTRRYRLFGCIALASVAAYGLMWSTTELIDRETSSVIVNEIVRRAGVDDSGTRSLPLAQLAAMFTAVGPFVSRRWRRAGAVAISLLVLVSVMVSPQLPAEVFLALPIGAMCGVAVLLAFGRPDRRPTLGAISAALTKAGLPVSEVRPASVDARGSTPYFATLDDGDGLSVK